ncbi:MAG TPA: malto-oligosyltrehalose trehalohydrolase [Bryobacteraceae bacterium]|nr:malto-oligosyltrehalose trehalohydrolase [Bryobacteraceae bacterium]
MGADVVPTGGVHFRVWAPDHSSVEVEFSDSELQRFRLTREDRGYWSGVVAQARAGMRYKYRLDGKDSYPDPASRFQPEGPHRPSQIVDPSAFEWCDAGWEGLSIRGQLIYELHVGTFTREGTWTAAEAHLPELAETGVTVIEVMPVNEFPGRFGWGYDGVHPFAPTRLYGAPDDFRRFIDRAHALRMAVILDVVYNHLGPDGNYLPCFSPYYFTDEYETDWGEAINFHGKNSGPVREFFTANAGYWISEFHLDGLRLDATQNIYDEPDHHILADITREVRKAAGARKTILVGENEPQETRLIAPLAEGGYGLDALWNDDFHHSAMVQLTGRNEAYYTDYLGAPQEFISAAKYGYLYQGQWYAWQKQRRGTPCFGLRPEAFVTFIQNHDQVANSARGDRCGELTSFGKLKAMTALMLLMPGTPMLFQGQEWGSCTPFLYFADAPANIAELVRNGRREFLHQFNSAATAEMAACLPDPVSEQTFERCKLDHTERERPRNRAMLNLHHDLIALRRRDPAFEVVRQGQVDGAVLASDTFVLRWFGEPPDGDRLLVVNFGRDHHYSPAPEPLLAPPPGMEWNVLWSTEDPRYAGCGTPEFDTTENWMIPGHAAAVLSPAPRTRTKPLKKKVEKKNG